MLIRPFTVAVSLCVALAGVSWVLPPAALAQDANAQQGPEQHIFIGGEVKRPGQYLLEKGEATLEDAAKWAEISNPNVDLRVQIIHRVGKLEIVTTYSSLILLRATEIDIQPLTAGDMIMFIKQPAALPAPAPAPAPAP